MRTFFRAKFVPTLKRWIPWGIAVIIFYLLFRQYPVAQVLLAFRQVHIVPFSLLAIAYFLYVLVVDTTGTAWMFSRFEKKVALRDLIRPRMATYPISIINYGAGQAAFAYLIQKARRISIRDIFGVFFLIMAADLCWVIALAFIGSCIYELKLGGVPINPAVRMAALLAGCAVVLHIAIWRLGRSKLISRIPFWSKVVLWLGKRDLVRIFREATILDYVKLALFRMPIHAMFPVVFFAMTYTFDTQISFLRLFGTVPVVLLIGILPITPGGLGTTNAALVEMLHPFLTGGAISSAHVTSQELVFAMSLLWMFANYFLKALIGTILLTKTGKERSKLLHIPSHISTP